MPPLSLGPPTMAVLPSEENATDQPWAAVPTAPLPTSLLPCWVNCASAGCDETSSAAQSRTDAPRPINDLPDERRISRRRTATAPSITAAFAQNHADIDLLPVPHSRSPSERSA